MFIHAYYFINIIIVIIISIEAKNVCLQKKKSLTFKLSKVASPTPLTLHKQSFILIDKRRQLCSHLLLGTFAELILLFCRLFSEGLSVSRVFFRYRGQKNAERA